MKRLTLFILILVILLFPPQTLLARVSGACSNCHTMHYSQSSWPSHWNASGGPFEYLLGDTCYGCHSATSGITKTTGGSLIPVVWITNSANCPSNQGPGYTLAGGNFCYVADTANYGDEYGHNVIGIASQDPNLGLTPPGWDPDYTSGIPAGQIANGATSWTQQLTCAGTYGCHGTHNASGVSGAHHNNEGGNPSGPTYGTCDGSDLGASFRFLYGIQGGEDGDWEATASSTDHNEYKGINFNTNRNQSNPSGPPSDTTTISYLCAQCHGLFHSEIDDTSIPATPFLRHPTDVLLPNSEEYSAYTSYSILAPVARPTIPSTPSATVTPGTDIVACISCHRAHGSPEPDLLRWDYDNCLAGTSNSNCGCFVCHTQKDGS